MTMLNILANITDQNLASQFLNDTNYQKSKAVRAQYNATLDKYYNASSPLAGAQIASENYRRLQQRKPMVIEYYKQKPTSPDASFIESVEMYINPQRLNIQYQKVKGKAYTRGGIFYHHWGDDNPIMSFSGVAGLAQMKFIEQLEHIYLNSGSLLKYGDLNLNKVNNGSPQQYKNLDFNNLSQVISSVIANPNGIVVNLALEGIDEKINSAVSASEREQCKIVKNVLISFKNMMSQTKYQDAYRTVSNELATEVSKNSSLSVNAQLEILYKSAQIKINKHPDLQNLSDEIKIFMAFELALPYIDSGDASILDSINKTQLDTLIKDFALANLTKISYDDNQDEWEQDMRAHPEVTYMKLLNLINQVTTDKKIKDAGLEDEFLPGYTLDDAALTIAKRRINFLRPIAIEYQMNKGWLNPVFRSYFEAQLGHEVFTTSYVGILDKNVFDWEFQLDYFSYASNKNNWNYKYPHIIVQVMRELERTQAVYEKEQAAGTLTDERKNQILNWIKQVRDNSKYTENYRENSYRGYQIINGEVMNEWKEYYIKHPEGAYVELLTIIDMVTLNKQVRDSGLETELSHLILDENQLAIAQQQIQFLRPIAVKYQTSIKPQDTEYIKAITSQDTFNYNYRLAYFALASVETDWNYKYPEVAVDVAKEIQRCQVVYNREAAAGILTDTRKTQILNWVKAIREKSQYMDNDWENNYIRQNDSKVIQQVSSDSTSSNLNSDIILKTHDIANDQASNLNQYIAEIQELNENWKIDREEAFAGWADIADEIFDEYRPRLIFIYFEDRLYIGHFDTFNWGRAADSPLITYEMRFTVVRQILMSSTGKKPQNTTSAMQAYFSVATPNITPTDEAQAKWRADIQAHPEKAYVELLTLIDKVTLDKQIRSAGLEEKLPAYILDNTSLAVIKEQIQFLRPIAVNYQTNIKPQDAEYIKAITSQETFEWNYRLDYFALASINDNGNYRYLDVVAEVTKEIQRCQAVYNNEASLGRLTTERKAQILNWVKQIREKSQYIENDWEKGL